MAILKKRPEIKSADDFINANPESIVETVLKSPEKETQPIQEEKKIEVKDTIFQDKAKEKFMADEEDEDQLRRVTTYVKDSLSDKIKILAVLTKKKEYQLWNEALTDLLEKYKSKGF